MKRFLAILILTAITIKAAQIWTVNTADDVKWLNANTINSNVFAVGGTTFNDGYGGMWTFKRGDTNATNTVINGGPMESVNPLSPAGRWFRIARTFTINPTDGYLPYRSNATVFGDSPFYVVGGTNVATAGQFIWGPGTTNVFRRSGSDLIYTNTSQTTRVGIQGSAGTAYFGANALGGATINSSGGTLLAPGFFSSATRVDPASGNSSLGSISTPLTSWNNVATSNLWVMGYVGSGTEVTNYSRLQISHGGTNSIVAYNSQGNGTAGPGRPQYLQTDGTNAIGASYSSTAGDTHFLLYDVDTSLFKRVSVGTNDSAGTGYKVLRIAN